MKIPFVDLHAQYVTIKQEIDRAIAEVIAQSAHIRGSPLRRQSLRPAAAWYSATRMRKRLRSIPSKSKERSQLPPSASFRFIFMDRQPTWARSWRSQKNATCGS